MRVQESEWTVRLNGREQNRHEAFPSGTEAPVITIRRLLPYAKMFVVEAVIRGAPCRLAKSGCWEKYDPASGTPATRHRYSQFEFAMNTLDRGTSGPSLSTVPGEGRMGTRHAAA